MTLISASIKFNQIPISLLLHKQTSQILLVTQTKSSTMNNTTMLQTPPKATTSDAENNPPIPNQQNSTPPPATCNSGKNGTPVRLTVPKPFKYSERYTSPTDKVMSPVSRGILARGRKGYKLLPPSANLHKIQALKLQESSPLPN